MIGIENPHSYCLRQSIDNKFRSYQQRRLGVGRAPEDLTGIGMAVQAACSLCFTNSSRRERCFVRCVSRRYRLPGCWSDDKPKLGREQGAGSREQGAGSREQEQGAGSREQGAGSREQGAGSRSVAAMATIQLAVRSRGLTLGIPSAPSLPDSSDPACRVVTNDKLALSIAAS